MTIATNRSATALAPCNVLPFTASVSIEADARRMAPGAVEADVPDQPVAHVQMHGAAVAPEGIVALADSGVLQLAAVAGPGGVVQTVAEDGTTYSLRPRNYHLYLVRRSVMDGLAKDVPAVLYVPFERALLKWLREVQINVDEGGVDVQALQARKGHGSKGPGSG